MTEYDNHDLFKLIEQEDDETITQLRLFVENFLANREKFALFDTLRAEYSKNQTGNSALILIELFNMIVDIPFGKIAPTNRLDEKGIDEMLKRLSLTSEDKAKVLFIAVFFSIKTITSRDEQKVLKELKALQMLLNQF